MKKQSKKLKIGYETANTLFFSLISMLLMVHFLHGYFLLFALLMSFSFFIVTLYLERLLFKKKEVAKTTRITLDLLHNIKTGMGIAKLPFAICIDKALYTLNDKKARVALAGIRKRLTLGQDLPTALSFSNSLAGTLSETFKSISEAYKSNFDLLLSIKHVYNTIFKKHLEMIEKAYASIQKYSSISMVLGAIVPSFMLFGFIGYSIIKETRTLFFVFIITFVLVLPFLFSTIRIIQAGLYEA